MQLLVAVEKYTAITLDQLMANQNVVKKELVILPYSDFILVVYF